ncbi:hypothetical protein [Streptomyces sp. NPDC012616]|uniref:hypothetical protein n=1 Tax=Streptomyces sp. NPDC012616 TaxID=3364840 RepID=UPI0036EA55AE
MASEGPGVMRRRARRLVMRPGRGALTCEAFDLPPHVDAHSVVRPLFVGICGTDLDILAGGRDDTARILGHEAVVHVPERRQRNAVGEEAHGGLYLVNPVDPHDQDRIVGHSEEGMLQEAVCLSEATSWAARLIPVRAGLAPLLAVISEPLAVAVYSLGLLGAPGAVTRLLVVGAGPMGVVTAVAARLLGVPEVALVDGSERRAQSAVDNGFVEEGLASCPSSRRFPAAAALYGGSGPDAVALCVGRGQRREALGQAVAVAAAGACIDLTTGFRPGEKISEIPDVELNLIRRRNVCGSPRPGQRFEARTREGKIIHLTGHRGTSPEHMSRAMDMLLGHPDVFRRVITDVVSVEDAPRAVSDIVLQRRDPNTAPYRKLVVSLGPS